MTTDSIQIVSSREKAGYTYNIVRRMPDGFGYRYTIEYGHGDTCEGRLLLDTDPRGEPRWLPHREIPTVLHGWPEDSEEFQTALLADIRQELTGRWSS